MSGHTYIHTHIHTHTHTHKTTTVTLAVQHAHRGLIIALQFMKRLQTKTSAGAMMASKERYTVDDIIQELEMGVECEGGFPDSCTSLITTACSPSG